MSQSAIAWAIQPHGITPAAKLVLILLADSAGYDGEGLVVMRTLAALAEVSQAELTDALALLERLGLICRSIAAGAAGVAGKNLHYKLACGRAG